MENQPTATPVPNVRYVFWSGGWDSTYLVIALLLAGWTVQPIYIVDHARKSCFFELNALDNLSVLVSERVPNGTLLPIRTFDRSEIKDDKEILAAWKEINQRLGSGRQLGSEYLYLSAFARQFHEEFPVIEMGLSKGNDDETGGPVAAMLKMGQMTPDQRVYKWGSAEIVSTVLGNFEFPIINVTEKDMLAQVQAWNYGDIMQKTWFCTDPIQNLPCGICPACRRKIMNAMEFLLPAEALERNKALKIIGDKYGHLGQKFFEWRLRRKNKPAK